MTTDDSRLNVEFLRQPGSVAYEFATYLSANRIGRGFTLGFYHKADLEQATEGFFGQRQTDTEESEQLKQWIDSLPWDANGRMAISLMW